MCRDHESAELEGQQPRRTPERPLGENDQGFARAGARFERGRVLDAAGRIETLDEDRAQSSQRGADKCRACGSSRLAA